VNYDDPHLNENELQLLEYLESHCASPDSSEAINASSILNDLGIGEKLLAELANNLSGLELIQGRKVDAGIYTRMWITPLGIQYFRTSRKQNVEKLFMEQMPSNETTNIDKKKIFVVHGRNDAARKAIFEFLRSIGLHPLEWSEIVSATGEAAPYIGRVLEKGFSLVQAVVILMTPDDEARLREQYHDQQDPEFETVLTPQPRPNVLIEAGMAMGLFQNRTLIIEFGKLRPASDILGRNVIRISDTSQCRQNIATRLRDAGCEVNTNGTDWMSAGNFQLALNEDDSETKSVDPLRGGRKEPWRQEFNNLLQSISVNWAKFSFVGPAEIGDIKDALGKSVNDLSTFMAETQQLLDQETSLQIQTLIQKAKELKDRRVKRSSFRSSRTGEPLDESEETQYRKLVQEYFDEILKLQE
tara:strand:+ start:206 stop:1447 length:1242 start_codon:yes stop_codon:yes gene_type:complete